MQHVDLTSGGRLEGGIENLAEWFEVLWTLKNHLKYKFFLKNVNDGAEKRETGKI